MAQKVYVVEGRQFRTEKDYACAKRDKEKIDKLRASTDYKDKKALQNLRAELKAGKHKFLTLLGQDFLGEVEEQLKSPGSSGRTRERKQKGQAAREPGAARRASSGQQVQSKQRSPAQTREDKALDAIVQEELRKREKRRKLLIGICAVTAACSLGYVGVYSYYNYRTEASYQQLGQLKEMPVIAAVAEPSGPLYTLDEKPEAREVLDEYKNLLIKHKKLIGWVKIDDTNIDFPVMQTDDNEYYLHHNLNQQYDKNGSIFMDKDCDVLKPSTNFILYGHHTKTGQMFGKLELYQEEDYYKEHQYINFDTIYEKGTYQIMYVFRSRVYKEDEIVFKYYQFIDANGEQEFNSNMQEMAAMSFYDTGVTAEYGDQLLTLSTCDYQEKDGRFVVVAKKIAKE